jgi:hypothetical protein
VGVRAEADSLDQGCVIIWLGSELLAGLIGKGGHTLKEFPILDLLEFVIVAHRASGFRGSVIPI